MSHFLELGVRDAVDDEQVAKVRKVEKPDARP
jgi:hypothetical protein